MKVLVTGACGFLGRGIVKSLLDEGLYVIATSNKETSDIDSRAKVVCCNIFDVDNPYEFFDRPDILLHLAWRDGFVHYSNAHVEDLPKHYEFFLKMINGGIKHIAVLGSMHEVGFFEGCINENTPCNPVTPYGICKNALRELSQIVCGENGVILQWMRGFYIVSDSLYGSSVFSKIAMAEKMKEKEFPFTLGQNQYDFVDYSFFCKAVIATILQPNEQGIINICSGRPQKLADRVEQFISDNKYSIRLRYGAFPDRPYDSKAVWGDSSRIEKILENFNR